MATQRNSELQSRSKGFKSLSTSPSKHIIIDGYPFRRYHWATKVRGRYKIPNFRELKLFLIKEYRVCYFCGVEVLDQNRKENERFWPEAATIDHLKPRPYRKKYEVVEKVLACYQCNHDRNVEEQSK